MELAIITKPKKGTQQQNNKKQNITKKTVKVEVKQQPKQKKQQKGSFGGNRLGNELENHIIAPDLVGPYRQPRFGTSAKTMLGMKRSRNGLVGSSNLVQGFQLSNLDFSSTTAHGYQYTVLNEGTALGAGAPIVPNATYPAAAQFADFNCTAMCIVAYYIGNPLTVQGEILVGSCISLSTTATYQSINSLPGVIRFPVAKLIEEPIRIYGMKMSEAANEFVAPTFNTTDWNYPFIFASGLPSGGALVFEAYSTWEGRSSTSSTLVIAGFEAEGPNDLASVDTYQRVISYLGSKATAACDAIPPMLSSAFSSTMKDLPNHLGKFSAGALSYLGARTLQNHMRGQRGALNVY